MKMIEFSLLDKIKTVFNLIFSSPLFLILLFGILLMILDIKFISKKDKKTNVIYVIASIVIIGLLLQTYFDSLLNIFDIIAKNIVSIIYFPTVLEYIVMLLLSLGILLYSIFSKKMNKNIKIINTFVFAINTFLFFLILDQISKSKVDLSNKVSIYTNDNLMILFEISIAIFIFWMIGLCLYKIINNLIHKNDITNNFYDEPALPKTIEELRNKSLIPEPKVEYVVVEKKNENDMFTLAEYRQMRALLEVIKKNQKKAN
jgi:hypothetical protein